MTMHPGTLDPGGVCCWPATSNNLPPGFFFVQWSKLMIKKCVSCAFSVTIQPRESAMIHWFVCNPCAEAIPQWRAYNEISYTNGFKQGMDMSPRGEIGRRIRLKI